MQVDTKGQSYMTQWHWSQFPLVYGAFLPAIAKYCTGGISRLPAEYWSHMILFPTVSFSFPSPSYLYKSYTFFLFTFKEDIKYIYWVHKVQVDKLFHMYIFVCYSRISETR